MYQYIVVLLLCCIALAWIIRRVDFLKIHIPNFYGKVSTRYLKEKSKTGDLVLFSGTGSDSSIVRAWSASKWTHIGMIVVDPKSGTRFLFNADSCKSRRNVVDGKYREGIQLNDLELYLRTYPGYAAYCPLIGKDISFEDIAPIIRTLNGKKFNHNWGDLLRCTFGKGGGWIGSSGEVVDRYFCSQLVAEVYFQLGIIGDKIPLNEYHPSSFAGELQADWIRGYCVGDLFRVRFDDKNLYKCKV